MAWSDKTLYADVRLSIERDQLRIDLSLDNMSGANVFIPDVSFTSTKDGIKINPVYLPLAVNNSNTLEANLLVQPLDPTLLWATPPTFFCHIIHPRDRYQRQWLLPYPVRILAKDNHGMGRTVPVSTDFLLNLGVIQPTGSYKPKEVEIDGQTLYEFGQEALRFQLKQQVILRNRSISLQIEG